MEATVTLELPRRVLESARVNLTDLKIELAVHLYQQKRLSVGQARELADLTLWEFRQLLASRRISPHYDVADLDEDIATWQTLSTLQESQSLLCGTKLPRLSSGLLS